MLCIPCVLHTYDVQVAVFQQVMTGCHALPGGTLRRFMVLIGNLGVVDTSVTGVIILTCSSGAPIWVVIPV